jgi:exopolysaccharide biosynthesis polyprenyl glycosylphosphotransferase
MNSRHIHIRKLKRIMDFCVAAFSLLLMLPICVLAAVAIKVTSKGPVFYRQVRMGLNGEYFKVIKFRTMYMDAERDGAVWAERYDARITRVGRFLRASRIDEIPQLVNVLRGQMSLVGPRPERPEFVETLSGSIPFYEERLLIPPGITGWAQIRYPYAASVAAARAKLQYDLYYIKHTSLLMDVSILIRTFKTIIVGLRHSEEPRPDRVSGSNLTVLGASDETTSKTDDVHSA